MPELGLNWSRHSPEEPVQTKTLIIDADDIYTRGPLVYQLMSPSVVFLLKVEALICLLDVSINLGTSTPVLVRT